MASSSPRLQRAPLVLWVELPPVSGGEAAVALLNEVATINTLTHVLFAHEPDSALRAQIPPNLQWAYQIAPDQALTATGATLRLTAQPTTVADTILQLSPTLDLAAALQSGLTALSCPVAIARVCQAIVTIWRLDPYLGLHYTRQFQPVLAQASPAGLKTIIDARGRELTTSPDWVQAYFKLERKLHRAYQKH